MAIPQRDQQGEGVDWYSSIPGDVVPWRSATESEREDARIQLKAFQKEIQAIEVPKEGQGGDQEVFARLLKWVCHFPDQDFVYLVDGTPVLTFWGFIHPEMDRHANPLQCLYPEDVASRPPPVSPALPAALPVDNATPAQEPAIAPAPALVRPWWRRFWWVWPLILLLGLLLLLLGLRACSSLNPAVDTGVKRPAIGMPNFSASSPHFRGLDVWPFNTGNRSIALPNGTLGFNGDTGLPVIKGRVGPLDVAPPNVELPNTALPSAALAELAVANSPELPGTGALPTEVSRPSNQQTVIPPTIEPLILPADAPDGAASFLDGNWQGAGVMDSQSGQPLQVRYAFDQGEGQMFIRRGGRSGVMCSGPVTAVMQSGELQVEAQEHARCEDGSNYEMPRVECHQNEGEMADCAASYDDEPFPMRLQKASE